MHAGTQLPSPFWSPDPGYSTEMTMLRVAFPPSKFLNSITDKHRGCLLGARRSCQFYSQYELA